MDARTRELTDRLVAPGPFPAMSASEGHELHDGVKATFDLLAEIEKIADPLYTGSPQRPEARLHKIHRLIQTAKGA